MEFRHLRCFLAVAEELHFARAAERLHIEQSPLSRTIKELEEDLGEQLFVRTSRSTRLTRAGKLFLEHVRTYRLWHTTNFASLKRGEAGRIGIKFFGKLPKNKIFRERVKNMASVGYEFLRESLELHAFGPSRPARVGPVTRLQVAGNTLAVPRHVAPENDSPPPPVSE